MHPVSRGFALDEEDYRPHASRRRSYDRSADAENNRRQHCRPDNLRFRRSVRMANAEFRGKISGRICGPRPQVLAAAASPGKYAPGTDRACGNPNQPPRPRSRLGKSRRRFSDLDLTLSHARALALTLENENLL